MLYGVCQWVGGLAGLVWLALATLVATNVSASPEMFAVYCGVAAICAAISLLVWWRTLALRPVRNALADLQPLCGLLGADVVTNLAMAGVGMLLIYGISSRIFGEGLPLFG